MNFNFPSCERLKSRKTIEHLFKGGKGFLSYPYKVVWCYQLENSVVPIQVAVSVPKRNFKHAVDRNTLKRRTKEAWRLQKHLMTAPEHSVALMFIYVAKEDLPYKDLEKGIKKAIKVLHDQFTLTQ